MGTELYRTLKELLGSGQWVRLESSLEPEHLGRQRMSWPGGTLGELPGGARFVQELRPPARLVICGGGHVSRALVPAAQAVGFQVTVLENRPEVLEPGAFPPGTDLRCGAFADLLRGGGFSPCTFYAVMTRGHQEDWTCVSEILRLPHCYLGVMGSRRKAAATREHLSRDGFAQAEINAIRSPIGLDIGAETPAEIAVSVVAELVCRRRDLGLRAPLEEPFLRALDHFPYAVVTLVDSQGSTPRGPGASMLVFPNGEIRGTIGGGIWEAEARAKALEALETGRPGLFTYRMDGSAGSICGGAAKYLIIPVKEDDIIC